MSWTIRILLRVFESFILELEVQFYLIGMFSKIKKRDGRVVDFDSERIKSAVHKAFLAVELGNGDKAEKITRVVVKLLESRFENEIPSVEDVQDFVIDVLRQEGYEKVALSYEDFRKKKEELRTLRSLLGIEPKLTINAMEVLRARYLLRDEQGIIIEAPTNLFERVAKSISKIDTQFGEDAQQSEKIFYDMMAKLEFLPNTPTLFNAGTSIGQLSACFVLPVEDSLDSIFNTLKNMATIEQTGGGVGFDFSNLRPRGDVVKSTKGVASGPVSFMRIFDTATDVIKAGGKRRGAMMAILRVDHPDIMDFITAKQNPSMLSNFNVSVAITDGFLDALNEDRTYWLVNPRNNQKVKEVKARAMWNLIAHSAWASGDPGVIFIDEINRHNPTPQIGRIESTNPCITSDTWIMTEDGARQARDLCGKSFVAIVNGKKWAGSKEGFFSTGIKPILRLITKEGFELRLTKNHPILKITKLNRHRVRAEWVAAETLKPTDNVALNSHINVETWGGNYTESEGYLTALLISESNFKGNTEFLSRRNKNLVAKTISTQIHSYGKDNSNTADFSEWPKVIERNEHCIPNGCQNKFSKNIDLKLDTNVFTENIEACSSEFCIGLLRGLFDISGSIVVKQSKSVCVKFSHNNFHTLKAIQRMLLRFGIFSTLHVNQKNNSSILSTSKYKDSLSKPHIVISKENIMRFSRKIGFSNSDKKAKFDTAIKAYKRKPCKEHFIATIAELIPEPEEEVYDAVIPGVNMFDANGFCVHNCGEQPLLPYESCNLGSINLSKMVQNQVFSWDKLRETIRNAVHFLDNVVDANVYPLKETSDITLANRKIGLGVMGFADTLITLGVPYDSEKALKFGEQIMAFIRQEAHKKSCEIAAKRGSFTNFKGSIWEKKYPAFRNATVTTIAPTGTISIIAGCSSGIEPLFAVSFMRNVLGGARLFETNPLFEEAAKKHGFYSAKLLEEIARTGSVQKIANIPDEVKRIFVTALDIDPIWHIKMQAVFQKYTDNAVSKTVNLPNDAKVEDVEKIYNLAWQLKCKGVTVFRYGSKPEQVLYIGQIKTKDGHFVSAQSEYAGGCPTQNCPFPA